MVLLPGPRGLGYLRSKPAPVDLATPSLTMASLPGSLDGVSVTLPTWLPWLGLIFTHLVAYWLGRWLKLRQLHRLQAQGLLTITTEAQPGDERIPSLMGNQPESEEELDIVAYARRDSEDRRDDWAIRMKEGEEGE